PTPTPPPSPTPTPSSTPEPPPAGFQAVTLLDVDQDPGTGFTGNGMPANDIGAEYAVRVFSEMALQEGGLMGEVYFWNPAAGWELAQPIPVYPAEGGFWYMFPLSVLVGDDDGAMDVVQLAGMSEPLVLAFEDFYPSDIAPNMGHGTTPSPALPPEPPWNEIISDPMDDQDYPGYGADIAGVDAFVETGVMAQQEPMVFFRVRAYDPLDFNWLESILWLDTDQNPGTGFSANDFEQTNDIGVDYAIDIYGINVVGNVIQGSGGGVAPAVEQVMWAAVLWWNSDPMVEDFEFIAEFPVFTDGSYFWTGLPLTALGGEEGAMDVVVQLFDYFEETIDIAPNMGHGTTIPGGPPPEPPWDEIIHDPLGDQFSGYGPDIEGVDAHLFVGVVAEQEPVVFFRVRTYGTLNPMDMGSIMYLDTDQNPGTGYTSGDPEIPTHDMGVDYMVEIFSTGALGTFGSAPAGSIEPPVEGDLWAEVYWWNSDPMVEDFEFIAEYPAFVIGNYFWFSMPLASLGQDDGMMDVVVILGDAEEPTDVAPNEGHGSTGGGEGEWFFKAPQPNYAGSGVPDFDMKQDPSWVNPQTQQMTFAGATAVANSFWWFDSKYADPSGAPGDGNDVFPLVRDYTGDLVPKVPGPDWDDHNFNNVNDPQTSWMGHVAAPPELPPFMPGPQPQPQLLTAWGELIERLAWYVDTDGARTGSMHKGVRPFGMDEGIKMWLVENGLQNEFYQHQVEYPDFEVILQEVKKSQDVILLLGFWVYDDQMQGWYRIGGHYATVAGVLIGVQIHNRAHI
ncbi:hypothetical protein ACFLTS_07395, partial [Chloroflexota bacterium]